MSITSTTRKAGPYSSSNNSSTTDFPFAFKVFQAADLLVVQTDNSPTPADTTLTLNTHYTVTLNTNQDSNPGGKVTLLTALPSGYLLTIGSQVAEAQGTTLTNTGGFYPAVINNALDYLTILIQQISEKLGRALVMPFSTNASGQLPPVSPGSLLGWKADGSGIDNVGATGVGAGGIVATNMAAGATGTALSVDSQAAASKATPVDADELPFFDSTTTPAFSLKRLSWANLKATLLSYFESIFDGRYVFSGADGSTSDVVGISTNTVLTPAAQSGKTIFTFAALTLTIPNTNGFKCRIYGNGVGVVTLAAAAGNLAFPDGSVSSSYALDQSWYVGVELTGDGTNIKVNHLTGVVQTTTNNPTHADNSGKPASTSWVKGYAGSIVLGQNQTWTDQTANRFAGTVYHNTTTRPMFVMITTSAGNPTGSIDFYINGVEVANQSGSVTGGTFVFGVYAIIPTGASYNVVAGGISRWWELA